MFVSHGWDLSLSHPSLILSLCLLLQICTKAEFSSGLFKISTNLREGHRSCKIPQPVRKGWKKTQPHAIKHNPSSQFANAVTFQEERKNQFLAPLSTLRGDESYNFSYFSKLLLTVPESPGCSRLVLSSHSAKFFPVQMLTGFHVLLTDRPTCLFIGRKWMWWQLTSLCVSITTCA